MPWDINNFLNGLRNRRGTVLIDTVLIASSGMGEVCIAFSGMGVACVASSGTGVACIASSGRGAACIAFSGTRAAFVASSGVLPVVTDKEWLLVATDKMSLRLVRVCVQHLSQWNTVKPAKILAGQVDRHETRCCGASREDRLGNELREGFGAGVNEQALLVLIGFIASMRGTAISINTEMVSSSYLHR